MKKILLLFILTLFYKFSTSQIVEKNLKLNDLIVRDTVETTVFPVFIVPNGRVWKVENFWLGPNSIFFINDIEIYRTGSSSGFVNSTVVYPVPIWLKGGERISYDYTGTDTKKSRFRFAAFEFILE